MTVYDVNLHLHASGLTEALQRLTKLCALILTIPVTSASAERSFQVLRLVHTYLWNSQGQNRPTLYLTSRSRYGLFLMGTEKSLPQTQQEMPTFYDSIINFFLDKNRRILQL